MTDKPDNRVLVRTESSLGVGAAARLAACGHHVAVVGPPALADRHGAALGGLPIVDPAGDVEAAVAAAADRLGAPVDRYVDCTPFDYRGGEDGDWVPAARCIEEMLVAGSVALRRMTGGDGRALVVLAPHWIARPDAVDVATVAGAAAAMVLNWATDLRESEVQALGLVIGEPRPADSDVAVVIDRLQTAPVDLRGQLLHLADDGLRTVDSQLMTPPWESRPTWTSRQVADAVAGGRAGRLVEPHYA